MRPSKFWNLTPVRAKRISADCGQTGPYHHRSNKGGSTFIDSHVSLSFFGRLISAMDPSFLWRKNLNRRRISSLDTEVMREMDCAWEALALTEEPLPATRPHLASLLSLSWQCFHFCNAEFFLPGTTHAPASTS